MERREFLFEQLLALNLEMAESIPVRTAMFAISRSQAFRRFQRRMGRATLQLNTAVVGLELVAGGGDAPVELGVKWTKPKSPEAARQVADQSREFLVTAALVYTADLASSFLTEIARERWLGFPSDVTFVAAREGAGPGGVEYSMYDRCLALSNNLGINVVPLSALLDLMTRWRNIIVHNGAETRSPRLHERTRTELLAHSEFLTRNYGGVDIAITIGRFEARSHPMRKDATILIAAVQNLYRAIDEAAIRRAVPDVVALERTALFLISDHFQQLGTRGWAAFCDLWGRNQAERQVALKRVLAKSGITDTQKPISPELPMPFLAGLSGLDRDKAAALLGVGRQR